jgi:DNA-binding transcriptional LysR family regulator
MFHREGQLPHVSQEAGEQHTILGLVAAGLGYSITAEGMRQWGTENVVYRPLAHQNAWVPMGVAWRRSDRSDPVRWFVETARQHGASAVTRPPRKTVARRKTAART